MIGKSCSTCKRGVPIYGCSDGGDEIVFRFQVPCGEWEERNDSVEHVALEMLGWINAHDTVSGVPFALRLFALGVKP